MEIALLILGAVMVVVGAVSLILSFNLWPMGAALIAAGTGLMLIALVLRRRSRSTRL